MLEGIDVSQYQLTTPSLTGRDFLIARASIGTRADTRYAGHVLNARAAGLVTGAYHFGHSDVDITRQVETFLDLAGDVDLYALDVEGAHAPSITQTRAFIDQCDRRGVAVGLYASESTYFEAGQAWRWVANWSQPPRIPWDIWQHRGSPLDLDRFDGTRTELISLGGNQETPMPGLQFRFLDRVTGTATVQGPGHALIRVDTGDHVGAPDGQIREVAGKIVLTAPAPGTSPFPAGTKGYLVGNVPGLTPDQSIAAMLLEGDVLFTPDSEPVSYPVTVGGKPAGAVTLP